MDTLSPLPPKKKIVVLTVPFGGGHLSAAKIITEALKEHGGDQIEATMIDVAEEVMPPGVQELFSRSYVQSVKNFRSIPYKLVYDFSDAQPRLIEEIANLAFNRLGRKLLQREQPDLIVATFPLLAYVAHRILAKEASAIPIVNVITDAGDVNKLWLMGVTDTIITATGSTIDYAVAAGVPREKMHYFGFPVLKEFSALPGKRRARTDLGLRATKPTVLVTNGGLGMNPKKVLNLASEMASRPFPYQVLFVCGRNEKLHEALLEYDFGDTEARVYGFVDNMPELVAASDVVCSKAGWLSLSEAIEAKRPLLIFDVIPGQEEPNARYVVRSGFGEIITEPRQIVDRLEALLAFPPLLKAYDEILKNRLSGRRAAKAITSFLLKQLKD